jgi:CheY-like chemotaxis protein
MPKILIIDDDADQILLYSTKFKLEGFEVLSANDGAKGMELAKSQKPDIIILDMILGGIDGLEILKQFKQLPEIKDIPVFLFTNLAKKDLAEKGLKMGAIKVMLKTDFLPKDVVREVREILEKK